MTSLQPLQPCLGFSFTQFVHRLPLLWSRCFFVPLAMCLCQLAVAIPPPLDNPPNSPLQRSNPHLYDLTVTVGIPWNQPYPPFGGDKKPLRWPLLPRSNWSFVADNRPIQVELRNGLQITSEQNGWSLCQPATPEGQWELQIPVAKRCQGSLTFQIQMRLNTFSSQLDEQTAAKISWPSNWQGDSKSFLSPSDFIESDEDIFSLAVTDALGELKQSIPVHHAAKKLIRYCLQNVSSNGEFVERSRVNVRGLALKGAAVAVKEGTGSACDLVCVCVATLRAAGIPARPVIGVTKTNTVGNSETEPRYIVWAEYALPTAGWVPFDPKRMQGTVDRVPVQDPWQGCGTMQFLNTRVPISYSFVAGGVKNAYDAIGPWSWIPIYRDRPLPVPQNLVSIPWYQSYDEEVFVLVPFSPSIQSLGLVFVGSGSSTPTNESH